MRWGGDLKGGWIILKKSRRRKILFWCEWYILYKVTEKLGYWEQSIWNCFQYSYCCQTTYLIDNLMVIFFKYYLCQEMFTFVNCVPPYDSQGFHFMGLELEFMCFRLVRDLHRTCEYWQYIQQCISIVVWDMLSTVLKHTQKMVCKHDKLFKYLIPARHLKFCNCYRFD